MAKAYTCPTCSETIPLDGVNIAVGVALCRSCGETILLDTLVDAEDCLEILSAKPPRGLRMERSIQGGHPELTITYKRMPVFSMIFSAIFVGVISFILINAILDDRSPWGSWLFVGCLLFIGLVSMVSSMSSIVITVCNGNGRIFTGLGRLGYTKHFIYNRQTFTRVGLCLSNMRVGSHQKELQIITPDQETASFMIMRSNNAEEYAFIIATLRAFFRSEYTKSSS